MKWSEQQEAVFAAVVEGTGHLVVQARAGTGKTTTIVEAVIRLLAARPELRVAVCAFNARIRDELTRRFERADLASSVAVRTLHQLGFALCRYAWPRIQKDDAKSRSLAMVAAREVLGRTDRSTVAAVRQLASLAKNTLAATTDDLLAIVRQHGLIVEGDERAPTPDELVAAATHAMEAALGDTSRWDFDDQLWLPVRWGVPARDVYDVVIVDEVQDMNRAQLWHAQRVLVPGGRMVLVGDDRQALYSWRGADERGMARMTEELGAPTLPLSITYRCPKAVVREAARIVPDFRADAGNPEGVVRTAGRAELEREARLGDVILSRTVAPLAGVCLGFIRRNVRACIAGRDYSAPLRDLVTRSKAQALADLSTWLKAHQAEQYPKLIEQGDEDRAEELADRVATLLELANDADSVEHVTRRLETLFVEDPAVGQVVCSTVHRAKGLEWDRVWLLADTFRTGPKAGREEQNIKYVAITRAKRELVFVRREVARGQ